MPLKHLTETVLIVLLGIAIILTGVLVSTLPHLPEGFLPWAVISFLTVVYPAVLYPLLKKNRADYAFRSLHFVPFGITVLWLLIEIATLKDGRLSSLQRVFTWGWTAPAVVIAFLLIAAFCLHVIRRRVPRLAFLTLLLVPFLAGAYVNEQAAPRWNDRLASVLWERGWTQIALEPSGDEPATVSSSSKGEKNLAFSSVPEEEEWRRKLRSVEGGKVHSSQRSIAVTGTVTGVNAATSLAAPVKKSSTSSSSSKKRLVKSGGEFEALALFLAAGYCATVHRRARRRVA